MELQKVVLDCTKEAVISNFLEHIFVFRSFTNARGMKLTVAFCDFANMPKMAHLKKKKTLFVEHC